MTVAKTKIIVLFWAAICFGVLFAWNTTIFPATGATNHWKDQCIIKFDTLFGDSVMISDAYDMRKETLMEAVFEDTTLIASLAREVRPYNLILFIVDTSGTPCCFRSADGLNSSIFDIWIYEKIKNASPWEVVNCKGKKYPTQVFVRYHL